jgi:hypothetical protein
MRRVLLTGASLHPASSNAFADCAAGYRYTEELAVLTDERCVSL